MYYIAQDVVNLIVDQLSLLADGCERNRHLQAASLVSTTWINRSQYHLFSTLEFDDSRKIERWCSRIKPDPYGVSRHARVLIIGARRNPLTSYPSPIMVSNIEPALPHFTSFKNLKEFVLGYGWLRHESPGVLAPIFSSSASTLQRLRWAYWGADICETWEDVSTLADLLPNLTHVDLSGCQRICETHVRLSAEGRSPASERFKIRELLVAKDTPFSLPFFESCGLHLQALNLHAFELGDRLSSPLITV